MQFFDVIARFPRHGNGNNFLPRVFASHPGEPETAETDDHFANSVQQLLGVVQMHDGRSSLAQCGIQAGLALQRVAQQFVLQLGKPVFLFFYDGLQHIDVTVLDVSDHVMFGEHAHHQTGIILYDETPDAFFVHALGGFLQWCVARDGGQRLGHDGVEAACMPVFAEEMHDVALGDDAAGAVLRADEHMVALAQCHQARGFQHTGLSVQHGDVGAHGAAHIAQLHKVLDAAATAKIAFADNAGS